MEKKKKSSCNNNKFKISAPTCNDNLNYLLDHILYHIFWIHFKKHGENTDNPSVKIYVNKIKNGITFRIKNGFSLENLTPGAMKLRGSTKNKITKDINAENVPHFKIT